MNRHPDPSQILALARAVAPELRDVLVHVAGCPACGEVAERSIGEVQAAERGRKVLSFERQAAPRSATLPTSPRVWWTRARSSPSEIASAEPLLAELLAQPEGQRLLLARNRERFHDLALVELVLEEGRTFCFEDPHRAGRLIDLGVAMVDLLDGEYLGRRLLDELRARGLYYRANVHRIVGELTTAEEGFRRAQELLARGSSRIEIAGLLSSWSTLRKVQNRVPEALEMLAEAAEIFESEGEDSKAGRVYAGIGNALIEIGEIEQAEQALSEALVRTDAGEDPRTLLGIRHNLVICLAEQERFQEAADLMAELEPDYDRFPDSYMRLRRRWNEAKVLAGLGREEEAERLLVDIIREYRESGLPVAAADASLELAMIYERQGRVGELRRLAEEMTSIYFSREIPRETAVALAFFVRAVEQERVTRLVIERVSGFRKRVQAEPELRFSDYP